jgi:hypothetical protein
MTTMTNIHDLDKCIIPDTQLESITGGRAQSTVGIKIAPATIGGLGPLSCDDTPPTDTGMTETCHETYCDTDGDSDE